MQALIASKVYNDILQEVNRFHLPVEDFYQVETLMELQRLIEYEVALQEIKLHDQP